MFEMDVRTFWSQLESCYALQILAIRSRKHNTEFGRDRTIINPKELIVTNGQTDRPKI